MSTTSASRASVLLLPALAVLGILFLLPVFHLVIDSVLVREADGWRLSFARYAAFFSDTYNWQLMARTLRISLASVVACLVLAFPVALLMRRLPGHWRSLLAIALLSPLLTSVVVRTLAWVVLLGPKGMLNHALATVGIGPLHLMYNEIGVIIGLTHVFFGYMLLSLSTSMLKLDESLLLAAGNLGASRWQVMRHVIFPLCLPGVIAGATLVFTMSASAYIVPALLGGTATTVMATEVYDLAISYLDWQEAAVVALVLFAMVWLLVAGVMRLGAGRQVAGVAR